MLSDTLSLSLPTAIELRISQPSRSRSSPSPLLEEKGGERRPFLSESLNSMAALPLPPNPDLDPSLATILYSLKRLVLRNVTRLHHRKENFILSHAEDLAPVQIDDQLLNPIELIPDDPLRLPDAVLLEEEALASFESSKSQFSSFLNGERRLRNVFHLLCDGVEKPQAIAAKLKLRRATVTNLRKQLRRRWFRCFPLPD